jgi:hypothetical protein
LLPAENEVYNCTESSENEVSATFSGYYDTASPEELYTAHLKNEDIYNTEVRETDYTCMFYEQVVMRNPA